MTVSARKPPAIRSWAAAALAAACGGNEPDSRPNVILILTDDQGYGDVGVHGNERIRTPNLDRFAREGIEMTRFYVSPVCAPTRASLMTGRYYYRTGVIHTSRGGAKMHGGETTLAERLRAAGYRTGIFGKWHLGDNYPLRPMDQGFEESLTHKAGGIDQNPNPETNDYFDDEVVRNGAPVRLQGYCTDAFFDAAAAFAEAEDPRPFFIYLPTNAPHTPLLVAEKYWRPYAERGLDETTARVYDMVENIDDNLGRLLAALERKGRRADTLIVFLSDNGPQQERYAAGLRGRKSMVYEGGIRALSFWQWPRRWSAPKREPRPAAHIDVAPTLLAAAGAQPPEKPAFDGANLLPLLDGAAGPPERKLFFQCHRGLTPTLYRNAAVVAERYKLAMNPRAFSDADWDPGAALPPALYDLAEDPGEQRDLAAAHPQIVADLKSAYETWFAGARASRGFAPGVIHLGSDMETPVLLSRYQDSTYVDGKPTTWSVFVERAGTYEFEVRAEQTPAEEMRLRIDGPGGGPIGGNEWAQPLQPGETRAEFDLPAGPAQIDVWVQARGKPRKLIADNSREGNVIVRYPGR